MSVFIFSLFFFPGVISNLIIVIHGAHLISTHIMVRGLGVIRNLTFDIHGARLIYTNITVSGLGILKPRFSC